jgi:hypothetical protein
MKPNEIKSIDAQSSGPCRGNWFWPTLILGGGLLLLLKAFGIGEEFDVFRILGSLLLLGLAIASLLRFRFFLFLVPLSLIVYLWRIQLGIADLDMKLLLIASILLSIGLSLVFRKRSPAAYPHHGRGDWTQSEEVLSEDELVTIESDFGEYTKYIHAGNLKKVRISSSFASAKVFFDNCQISPEGLEINLNVHFAGVVLMIPKTWQISSQASVFAAEISDMTPRGIPAEHIVRLTGNVNFAEVKIIAI